MIPNISLALVSTLLRIFFGLLLAETFRFLDFGEGSSAISLVIAKPSIVMTRGSVHRPLNHSVKRGLFLTGSVAFPPVLFVQLNLHEINQIKVPEVFEKKSF